MPTLSWGRKVSERFRARVYDIGHGLGLDPSDLMACMAWESGETFSPAVRNAAGSGAVGLIQFMPSDRRRPGDHDRGPGGHVGRGAALRRAAVLPAHGAAG
jgi:hypothetical protein